MIATLALPGAEKAFHPGTKLDLQAGLPSGTGSGAPGLLTPPHPGTPSIGCFLRLFPLFRDPRPPGKRQREPAPGLPVLRDTAPNWALLALLCC